MDSLATQAPEDGIAPRNLAQIILRNAVIVTAAQWAMKIGSFLYGVYVIRQLNEVGFGQYSSVIAFVGMFGVFFELGLTQYVERSIAQDRTRTHELFGNLVALRLLLAVAGVISITGLSIALGHEPFQTLLVLLATLSFVPSAFLVPLGTLLTANERFDISTALQIGGQLLSMAAGLALLSAGAGVVGLLCVGFIVMPVQIAACVWAIRRHRLGPLRLRLTPRLWPAVVRASLPFGLTSLALTFNYSADSVILSHFHPPEVVGWYNVAYGLVFMTVAISDGLLLTMTPSLAREHVVNPDQVRTWTRASIHWLALLALPAAVGMSLLAEPIVELLYGANFAPAAPVLAVICWDIPLLLFAAFGGNVTAATGRERPAARIYFVSAALNVILNLLLIPTYGMMAAAAVTLITDGIACAWLYLLLRDDMELHRMRRPLLLIVLASGLMGAGVWTASALPLPLLIVLGAGLYALLALWLKLVDRELLASLSGRAVSRVRVLLRSGRP